MVPVSPVDWCVLPRTQLIRSSVIGIRQLESSNFFVNFLVLAWMTGF